MRWPFLVVVLLTATACGGPTMVIESDTSWSGSIGGTGSSATYSGSGNREFDLESGTTCWSIQKQTRPGRLRAYVKRKTITGSDVEGDATTNAEFGVVSGCGGS